VQVPLRIVHRDPPASIHNQTIYHIFHRGDVAKLEILLQHGGIYLDYDVIVVNSLDPLRRYDATLGQSTTDEIFLPRDAMLARVTAMALCLCLSVCLSQVGGLSKRLNESSWFLAR